MIVKVTKGQQITIPSRYRKDLGLRAGSTLEMTKRGNRITLQPIDEDLDTLFDEAKGITPKHRLTAKQMDELIEHEVLR